MATALFTMAVLHAGLAGTWAAMLCTCVTDWLRLWHCAPAAAAWFWNALTSAFIAAIRVAKPPVLAKFELAAAC